MANTVPVTLRADFIKNPLVNEKDNPQLEKTYGVMVKHHTSDKKVRVAVAKNGIVEISLLEKIWQVIKPFLGMTNNTRHEIVTAEELKYLYAGLRGKVFATEKNREVLTELAKAKEESVKTVAQRILKLYAEGDPANPVDLQSAKDDIEKTLTDYHNKHQKALRTGILDRAVSVHVDAKWTFFGETYLQMASTLVPNDRTKPLLDDEMAELTYYFKEAMALATREGAYADVKELYTKMCDHPAVAASPKKTILEGLDDDLKQCALSVAQQNYKKARALFKDKNYKEAIPFAEKAAAHFPIKDRLFGKTNVMIDFCKIQGLKDGEFEQGLEFFDLSRALNKIKDDQGLTQIVFNTFIEKGMWKNAVQCFPFITERTLDQTVKLRGAIEGIFTEEGNLDAEKEAYVLDLYAALFTEEGVQEKFSELVTQVADRLAKPSEEGDDKEAWVRFAGAMVANETLKDQVGPTLTRGIAVAQKEVAEKAEPEQAAELYKKALETFKQAKDAGAAETEESIKEIYLKLIALDGEYATQFTASLRLFEDASDQLALKKAYISRLEEELEKDSEDSGLKSELFIQRFKCYSEYSLEVAGQYLAPAVARYVQSSRIRTELRLHHEGMKEQDGYAVEPLFTFIKTVHKENKFAALPLMTQLLVERSTEDSVKRASPNVLSDSAKSECLAMWKESFQALFDNEEIKNSLSKEIIVSIRKDIGDGKFALQLFLEKKLISEEEMDQYLVGLEELADRVYEGVDLKATLVDIYEQLLEVYKDRRGFGAGMMHRVQNFTLNSTPAEIQARLGKRPGVLEKLWDLQGDKIKLDFHVELLEKQIDVLSRWGEEGKAVAAQKLRQFWPESIAGTQRENEIKALKKEDEDGKVEYDLFADIQKYLKENSAKIQEDQG